MASLKISLVTSLFLFSSLCFAKWTKVAESVEDVSFYADFNTMRKEAGYIYIWTLDSYAQPHSDGTHSEIHYNQVDCKVFRVMLLDAIFYNKPMGQGSRNKFTADNLNEWLYYPPDTTGAVRLQQICNKIN